jgi:hypothetical protein
MAAVWLKMASALEHVRLDHRFERALASSPALTWSFANEIFPSLTIKIYRTPFLASSIFLAVSPCLKPPLLAQTRIPSPISTFSSTDSCGHGQW